MSTPGRSKLGARRLNSGTAAGGLSEKARGKLPASAATASSDDRHENGAHVVDMNPAPAEEPGRPVVIRFSGYPSPAADVNGDEADTGRDLDVWVDHGESVGRVKDKASLISHADL